MAGCCPRSRPRANGALYSPERCRRWMAAASPRQTLVSPWKLPRANGHNRLADVPQDEVEARVIAARQAKAAPGAEQPPGRHDTADGHP